MGCDNQNKRERIVWKRIKALTRRTISDYLLPFSCDRSTAHSRVCGIWDAAVLTICEAKMSRCTWITVFWSILCIFESCGGIFNTADLEFKRETIIPCLSPKCLAQVFWFFFFSLSHSLYNSSGSLVYKTGVFLCYYLEHTCRTHTNLNEVTLSRPVQLLSESSWISFAI